MKEETSETPNGVKLFMLAESRELNTVQSDEIIKFITKDREQFRGCKIPHTIFQSM
jgi:hypothetical protein